MLKRIIKNILIGHLATNLFAWIENIDWSLIGKGVFTIQRRTKQNSNSGEAASPHQNGWIFRHAIPALSYLIFVNSITYISKVEKKLSMWRNFRFQHMTGVEKSDNLPNLEEFEEIWYLPCFGCKICFVAIYLRYFTRKLFCFNSKRFNVERNWAENCIGGEKMTNMRYEHCDWTACRRHFAPFNFFVHIFVSINFCIFYLLSVCLFIFVFLSFCVFLSF